MIESRHSFAFATRFDRNVVLLITSYACIAEDFETVKQIYYENCLKSRELHQCKDRQFYTMIVTLPIPLSTNLTVHRQTVI